MVLATSTGIRLISDSELFGAVETISVIGREGSAPFDFARGQTKVWSVAKILRVSHVLDAAKVHRIVRPLPHFWTRRRLNNRNHTLGPSAQTMESQGNLGGSEGVRGTSDQEPFSIMCALS